MKRRRFIIRGFSSTLGYKDFVVDTLDGSEVTRSQAQNKCFKYGYNFVSVKEVSNTRIK